MATIYSALALGVHLTSIAPRRYHKFFTSCVRKEQPELLKQAISRAGKGASGKLTSALSSFWISALCMTVCSQPPFLLFPQSTLAEHYSLNWGFRLQLKYSVMNMFWKLWRKQLAITEGMVSCDLLQILTPWRLHTSYLRDFLFPVKEKGLHSCPTFTDHCKTVWSVVCIVTSATAGSVLEMHPSLSYCGHSEKETAVDIRRRKQQMWDLSVHMSIFFSCLLFLGSMETRLDFTNHMKILKLLVC